MTKIYYPQSIEEVQIPTQQNVQVLNGSLEGVNLLKGEIRIGGSGRAGELIIEDENGVPSVYITKQKVRASLPSHNAMTDTDLDHFSLISDVQNVLLKEKQRGVLTFAVDTQTIPHNLGYIPDFKCYVYDNMSFYAIHGWKLVGAQNSAFFLNNYTATADETNIYISNNTGVSTTFVYKINFDEQAKTGTPSFTKSGRGLYVSRANKDANGNNPNDFILHTDLNSEPILKQGTATINFAASGEYTINHGLALSNPCAFDLFLKFPDGRTVCIVGENPCISRDRVYQGRDAYITTSQIKVTIERLTGSGSSTISAAYLIYDLPLTGGTSGVQINKRDHKIRVSKDAIDADTHLGASDYKFLSGYNYLKYYVYGNNSITIVGDRNPLDLASGTLKTSEVTLSHGLGYVPFWRVYSDDPFYFPNEYYAITPFVYSTFADQIRCETYADATNIYLKFFNKSPNVYTGRFYYKIYLNKLNI